MIRHGLIIVLFYFCNVSTVAEIYSSVGKIETMMEKEYLTLKIFENYFKENNVSKSFASSVQKYNETIQSYNNASLENPVIVYVMMKEIFNSWEEVEKFKYGKYAKAFKMVSDQRHLLNLDIPNEKDLNMSMMGLVKLQSVYDLKPSEIIFGNLSGTNGSNVPILDAWDCYKAAFLFASDQDDMYNALLWMEEANKFLNGTYNRSSTLSEKFEIEIIKLHSVCLYRQGNAARALKRLQIFVEDETKNEEANVLIDLYKKSLNINDISELKFIPPYQNTQPNLPINMEYEKYKLLCNNKIMHTILNDSTLNCYYKKDTHFLKIAPFKVEILHRNPNVLIFRNMLHDSEIEKLKDMAKRKLFRAPVSMDTNGTFIASEARVAQIAILLTNESVLLKTLNERFELMTNLSAVLSEDLQINSYGIGGHYYLHTDYFGKSKSPNYQFGDRIATLFLYLSTTNAGGATIFFDLNLTVYPSKGDALFWYNLKANGKTDNSTIHSGCPVLSGVKWAANKWFLEYSQIFRRPCSLDKYD